MRWVEDCSWGDIARTMGEAITRARKKGKNFIFVWLDLMNLDRCFCYNAYLKCCPISARRDLAREIPECLGVSFL